MKMFYLERQRKIQGHTIVSGGRCVRLKKRGRWVSQRTLFQVIIYQMLRKGGMNPGAAALYVRKPVKTLERLTSDFAVAGVLPKHHWERFRSLGIGFYKIARPAQTKLFKLK